MSYPSHYSAVTHLSLNLIITHLHVQVLDRILMVVVVHVDLTLALMREGAVGLKLEVYSSRSLVGSAITTSTITMIALRLDSVEVLVDQIQIRCRHQDHRG